MLVLLSPHQLLEREKDFHNVHWTYLYPVHFPPLSPAADLTETHPPRHITQRHHINICPILKQIFYERAQIFFVHS